MNCAFLKSLGFEQPGNMFLFVKSQGDLSLSYNIGDGRVTLTLGDSVIQLPAKYMGATELGELVKAVFRG